MRESIESKLKNRTFRIVGIESKSKGIESKSKGIESKSEGLESKSKNIDLFLFCRLCCVCFFGGNYLREVL